MARLVSVLYVQRRSIYKSIDSVDAWDVDRDATRYPGPNPIIAHPPCGHWGKYAHRCKLPGRECGPIAVRQVQKWGGVLEHPQGSRLFSTAGIPRFHDDLWGGRLLLVNQSDWGHLALKPTLLYFVRCVPPPLPPPMPGVKPMERLTASQRNATPPDLAAWLLEAVRGCA